MTDPAYVALALTPGIGRARLNALLAEFGAAASVLDAPSAALQAVPGMTSAAATAVRERKREHGAKVLARIAEMGASILLPDDPAFPRRLREIPDAPVMLFAAGRMELLDTPAVAIVGSRGHSRYGAEAARFFAAGSVRAGLTVVSGMARGVDAIAHEAALEADGGTVGVLGNGLGVVYPSANARLYEAVGERGCLITEFPPGERPNAGSFTRRNRLISGLARLVLVVEAGERSGALVTAGCAVEQGRDVLAVPGSIFSPVSKGCNRLIQQGAKPALGIRDVVEEFGIAMPGAPGAALPSGLSSDERRVIDLVGSAELHVDQIADGLQLPTAHALALLTSLEIRGVISQQPGKLFRKADIALF